MSDGFKVAHFKFEDVKDVIEGIKEILKQYDMTLIETEGDRYTFDRDGDFTRTIVIKEPVNGWITVMDEDEEEDMLPILSELSARLNCFAILIGIYRKMLYYSAFNNGDIADEYKSTLDYYEYEVNEEVQERYKGSVSTFKGIIDEEYMEKFQEVLDDVRDGSVKVERGYESIEKLLGTVDVEDKGIVRAMEDEDMPLEAEPFNLDNVFYVDFKNINVKGCSREDVIGAVENIVQNMGYKKVEDFNDGDKNKSLFKKLLNSITESRRLRFYVSPLTDGWVTLVGEVEKVIGKEPSEWEFLNIEKEISADLEADVIKICADSEGWRFNYIQNGEVVFGYSSEKGLNTEGMEDTFPEVYIDRLKAILEKPSSTPQDVDDNLKEFCELINIKNYRINIPMDFTEDEYKDSILAKLPDGENFEMIRFM